MVNILIGCTGSVATIKLPLLIDTLKIQFKSNYNKCDIQVITTNCAKHFCSANELPSDTKMFDDSSEWTMWQKRGDPVLHIELGKWADIFLIAPLDANSLAKLANGLCDNLLTCTARAWDISKPLIVCPAMNTRMYNHPITDVHLKVLASWGYHIMPVIEKTLMCGDVGAGAMAEVNTIVNYLINICVTKKFENKNL